MIRFRREIVGFAAAVALAVTGSIACESDIAEDDGNESGGTGGSGPGGGTECQPTAEICYGNRPATSPGSECLATIDNTDAPRVQLRQTWNRVVAPVGNTVQNVYSILKQRAQINLSECFMTGEGGYIQLTDWDRSNPVKTEQIIRTGYASFSRQPPTSAAPKGADLVTGGLCMVTWDYTFNPPATMTFATFPDTDLARWQDADTPEVNRPLPQPWHIEPVEARRIETDFTDAKALRGTVPAGSGVMFIDEDTGYLHSYVPLAYVTVLDNRSGGLAVPIREVEVRTQFNDNSFNCIGRFRADKMTTALKCDSTDDKNPPWGCEDDAACPPTNVSDRTGPGLSPSYTRGYFLIVDLERVWSSTLQATLCVTYPGEQRAEADGWSNPGGWGKNCRGSPQWDPTLPDDAGLPRGDWCSRENGPATDTCHDAYLSESFSTGQAFKVKDGACALEPTP